jgi:fructan beta-fructosidase
MRTWIGLLAVAAGASALPLRADELYHERWRPQFHFTPPQQWMNDPNGLVYDHGEYHLFYQYNPYSNTWGPMHWGHAVSRDSVSWENLPIALYPDRNGTIFSGSVVVDADNTSGLGTRTRPPLVAMFTYQDHLSENLGHTGFQSQGLAYSRDRGRNWTKYPGNPVLTSPAVRDFRDPKLLWHAPTRRWIAALAVGDHIAFYSSRNLKRWVHESDFGWQWGSHAGVWECPDLVAMRAEVAGARKYVLLVSIGKGGPNGGSATQYFVGDFDGHHFTLDADQPQRLESSPLWLDYGTDDYAGSTWSGGSDGTGRPRFIGWMSNWQYARDVPTERWRSAMTLPRELRLVPTSRGLELHAVPVPELARLRRTEKTLPAQTIAAPVQLTAAADGTGGLLELNLDVDTRGAALIEMAFANAAGETTVFRIDRKQRRYELDRTASGVVDFSKSFAGVQTAPLPGPGERVTLRVFLDQSSVEVFVNDGETVFTSLVFPRTPYDIVTLRADQAIGLNAATIHELRSIWSR